MMTWLLRFSVAHPRVVLLLVLVATSAALLSIPQLQLRLDGRSLIPENQPEFAPSDEAASLFELRDLLVVGVRNNEAGVYQTETLARISRLSEGLSRIEGVVGDSVLSLATAPRLSVAGGTIDTRPLLEKRAEVDEEAATRLRRETEAQGLNNGVLVSPDGRAAAIVAKVSSGADRYRLLEQTRQLVAAESGGADKVYISGTALAQATLGESAARDLLRLIPAVIVVLSLMLLVAFRHPSPALLSLTEICVSLIWVAGLMGLTGQPVFVTTLILPVVLIAVGISDDVYALSHYFDAAHRSPELETKEVVAVAFGEVIRPISLTAISTITGLLSMTVAGLEPLRVFGLCGAMTIVFSTLFTFTLVPALLVILKPRPHPTKKHTHARSARLIVAVFSAITVRRRRRRVLALAFVVALCAAALMTRLRVDDSWIKNLPADSDIVRGDQFFNESLAGTTTVELMFDSGEENRLLRPEVLDALGEVERGVSGLGYVGAVQSLYDDVLRVNASLRGLDYTAYRESLRQGRVTLSRAEVEQALLLLSTVRRVSLKERVDESFRRTRLTIFIRDADYRRIDGVLRAALAGVPEAVKGFSVVPFGDGWISYLTVHLLVRGQVYSIALAMLTDLCLMSLLLRSLRMGLITLLPVAFSVLMVFAALALTNTPLGIANSMFAGIAIGVGLDFSIHLCASFRQWVARGLAARAALEHVLAVTGPAICTSAASITAGFAVLLLSEVTPNAQLGAIICLSLLTCAATTLILAPCLLMLREGDG
jgi:predicted RND superfamily exporter protein